MIGSYDGSLKQAPGVLYGIGMNVSAYVFLNGVVDRLMPCVVIGDAFIGSPVVREVGGRLVRHNLSDELVEGGAVTGLYDLEDDLSFALYGSHHDGLVVLEASTLSP